MSEIRVTTLSDTAGGNSSTAEQIFNGRVKAWVNWNGQGTVAIRDDFNVNTISDRSVGRYTVNFSSALADADYTVTGSNEIQVSATWGWCGAPSAGRLSGSCQIDTVTTAGTGFDRAQCSAVFCR